MPFAKKGASGLTVRLDVRVAPAEKARLREIADTAGIAVAELVGRALWGGPSYRVRTRRPSVSYGAWVACSSWFTARAVALTAVRRLPH